MIADFLLVLMTQNLEGQINFYQHVLELDLIFKEQNVIGFGKNKRLFIVLRRDDTKNSHHLAHHKGPQIITFKYQGNSQQCMEKIKDNGFKVRDEMTLAEHNIHYLFIEDYDGNEICLDFSG